MKQASAKKSSAFLQRSQKKWVLFHVRWTIFTFSGSHYGVDITHINISQIRVDIFQTKVIIKTGHTNVRPVLKQTEPWLGVTAVMCCKLKIAEVLARAAIFLSCVNCCDPLCMIKSFQAR